MAGDRIELGDGVTIIADSPLEIEFQIVDKDQHENPYAVLFDMIATYLRDAIEPVEVHAFTVQNVVIGGKIGLVASVYTRTPLDWVRFLKEELS